SPDRTRVTCSAQLERAEREERAEQSDDPEAHDDLRLLPAQLLEVMMEGRASEDAVRLCVGEPVAAAAVFEDVPLEDHRQHLGDEHRTDEREHELRLEQDRHAAQAAAER